MSDGNGDGQRNGKGQFVLGHSGMGGRPKGSRTNEALRAIFHDAIDDEKAKEFAVRLYELAMDGHPVAMKLCAERLFPFTEQQPQLENDGRPFFAMRASEAQQPD